MNCIECGSNYDSEYLMFCPMCGAKSPNVELPLASEFFKDEQGGKRLVPQGFMLEPISGYYYSIKKKQVSDRTYVNEITWFDSTSGKSAKKDYLMSSKEIVSMTSQQNENISLPGILSNNLKNERAQSASRKKKSFLVAFVVVTICISLGYCAINLNWIQDKQSTDYLQQDGYVYTEGDKKYFIPVSENYAIVKYKDREYYILYSFDETGANIKCRCRITFKETISESLKQTFKESFQKTNISNINTDDNVLYYDLPVVENFSRELLINGHIERGESILVDKYDT